MGYVKFEKASLENRAESIKAGRTVYDEAVEATLVMDNKTSMKFVWPEGGSIPNEIRLYHMDAYLAWNAGQEHVEGTPLAYLPGMTPAQADNLKSYGIVSVEQLAGASVAQLGNIMGGMALKASAQAYMDTASGSGEAASTVATLTNENEMLRRELEELRERAAAAAQTEQKDKGKK